MGLQKYRADVSDIQNDGAVIWWAEWRGGRTIAKIENCRLDNLLGDMRTTVYATGEPDTYFSIPAKCRLFNCTVNGYITSTDGDLVFRQVYY